MLFTPYQVARAQYAKARKGGEWSVWTTDWTTRAACKGTAPDELFVQGAAQNRAKLICRACPVRTECLADALDNGIEFGVWGGMTERERRALLRRIDGADGARVTFSFRSMLWLAMREYDGNPPIATDPPELSREAAAALEAILAQANSYGAWVDATEEDLTRVMRSSYLGATAEGWTASTTHMVLNRLMATNMIAVIKAIAPTGRQTHGKRGGIQVLVTGFEYSLLAQQRAATVALAEAERALEAASAQAA